MSEVLLTDGSFEQEVLKSKGITMVDFYADWCGPCKMMAPVLEKMADTYDRKVKVCKLNVDENPETSTKYGIQGIPTLLFFKNGELVDQNVGFLSEENIKIKFDSLLEAN